MLCIGAGGLGSPVLLYLAAAGVGRIGIVDFDLVEESNLQRQVIHGSAAVGGSKLTSAKARILDLNPRCVVDLFEETLTSENAIAHPRALRRDRRRLGQLPDALPRERRLRDPRQALRLRIDLQVRGAGVGLQPRRRTELPRPLPATPAARARAVVRGGRRARRAARRDRGHPGDRDREDPARQGRHRCRGGSSSTTRSR